jgi:hypothetical protein
MLDRSWTRLPVALLSALTGLWAAVGIVAALLNAPPAVFTAGFELIVVIACGLTVRSVLRQMPGRAMTIACAAGAIFVGAVLGHIAAGGSLMGHSLQYWTFARVGIAGLLALVAAADLLGRAPRRTLPPLLIGVGLMVPVGLLAFAGSNGMASSLLAKLPGPLQLVVMFVLFFFVIGLISASIHQLLRAFAIASDLPESSRPDPAPAKVPA